MTQIRPRIGDDLAAEVQAYADQLSSETGIRVSFNAAVTVLLRRALKDITPASQQQDAGSKP